MSKARLNQVASAVRGTFDRKTVSGVLIGVTIMMSALATAQTSGSGGWFSGLFSTGGSGSGSGSGSALISQQDSVVAAAINQEATDCANGSAGTIGAAISTAMNVHSQMASATPNVESLFDVNSDCFSSIGQIFDLSFSIPSLASILSAAQDAVLKYAQKKVCTAVNKVTGMVTTPINQAIGQINQLQGFTDINGMANSAIGGAMTSIDPQLGSQYHGSTGGTYTANTNPFGSNQTTFDGSGGDQSGLNNNTAQINALTQQIANQQIKINQDQMNLQNAQNNYNSCSGGWQNDCSAAFAALQQAQQQLAADQATLISLQTQLSQVVTQSGNITAPTVSGQSAMAQPQSASTNTQQSSSSGSWWSGVSNLFN